MLGFSEVVHCFSVQFRITDVAKIPNCTPSVFATVLTDDTVNCSNM